MRRREKEEGTSRMDVVKQRTDRQTDYRGQRCVWLKKG